MKIQCDVCEKAPASLICCADEAALCARCDLEVHAANKLASKHQRLLLQNLSTKLPTCDICQDKPAFIFCVEDRALFCKDCDEPIHSASSLSANHQRFLATGIRVALSTGGCSNGSGKRCLDGPPSQSDQQTTSAKRSSTQAQSNFSAAEWVVDDFLRFSPEPESSNEKKEQLDIGEFDWLNDMGLFGELAQEVPQLPIAPSSNTASHRPNKSSMPVKKPRFEISEEDEDFFTVPDLG